MFPLQGGWSVEQYLRLDTGLLIEYTDGFIRVLPMPGLLHQWIVRFLFRKLDEFVTENELGEVLLAPLAVELAETQYREPDLVFLRSDRIKSWTGQPKGADLVMEIVSEGKENRDRDYVEKHQDYAEAGIPEYWIVDPQERKITVLKLEGNEYREHCVAMTGDIAQSATLARFSVKADEVFSKCDDATGNA